MLVLRMRMNMRMRVRDRPMRVPVRMHPQANAYCERVELYQSRVCRVFNEFRGRTEYLRTTTGSRSALTATNNSLAPTSMPAACGCKMGNCSHRLLDLFAIGSSEDRPDAQGANQRQTPNRDRRQS
jgi:hypothetical protein